MATTGKQSPLGINVLSALMNSTGLSINSDSANFMGTSKTNSSYSFGSLVSDTVLRMITWAINDGYLRGPGNSNTTLTDATYNNLISIGSSSVGALGNSCPISYRAYDPSGQWTSAGTPATTGYSITGNTDQGQSASWLPYDTTNPNKSITQWGYIRLHALQAWNEFNWNGISPSASVPEIKDFCGSFTQSNDFANTVNPTIHAIQKSKTFMDGVYSNMNDLISADITGVSLATQIFGNDLVNAGKTIDLSRLDAFGLPSLLLSTLGKNMAITQDLTLLLLACGISAMDLESIISNSRYRITIEQEKKLYGAFLLISGENLKTILASLDCTTTGINTLADLLDVKKLFPNSFNSLTVPKYNAIIGLPTNSKTYFLIYEGEGINSALTTPIMDEYVGEQVPSGDIPETSHSQSPDNYRTSVKGFGSYLIGILPKEQAIAAGAFQFSMRQIPNISQTDISRFSRAVTGIETTQGLSLINGTSVPTDTDLVNQVSDKTALGSGPQGSYTMSDFFGCMSGLPYAWKLLYDRVKQLETTKLYNIYQQLFLAVTWEQATATVIYSTVDVGGTLYYTPTAIEIDNPGGGYGRGTAAAPTITLSNGGTATVTIGTNDYEAASNGEGSFGRVVNITLNSSGSTTTTIPTATIQAPPIDILAVLANGDIATGGTNYPSGTVGWNNPMNLVVQSYIDQANTEIFEISNKSQEITRHLNSYWNSLGEQLTIEQRARYIAIPPVNILMRDNFLYAYPSSIFNFTDTIGQYAQDTHPHMTAQTLEAIATLDTVGGQSLVGMMRQERNSARLNPLGIPLENTIPDSLNEMESKTLLTNGTMRDGISNNTINGYLNPAWLSNRGTSPIPKGTYLPTTRALIGTYIPASATAPGDITSLLDGEENATSAVNIAVGQSPAMDQSTIVAIRTPRQLDPNNLPIELDPLYASSTTFPSSARVNEAVDTVTHCNCDCWEK